MGASGAIADSSGKGMFWGKGAGLPMGLVILLVQTWGVGLFLNQKFYKEPHEDTISYIPVFQDNISLKK